MTKNIRRFAAAVSLMFVFGTTPMLAAPSRDGGDRDRSPIARVIYKLLHKLGFGSNADITPPIPGVNP